MSLVAQTLAIVVCKALAMRTWAGPRVLEQPVDPIDSVLSAGSSGEPLIAVYVEQIETDTAGRDTSAPTTATIKIVTYIPPNVRVHENGVDLAFTATGAGLVLNAMGRQIDAALHHGNAPWVALLRRFVVSFGRRKARFILVELENGARIPCAEVAFEMDTVPEPEVGRGLYGAWSDLDAQLRAEGEPGAADLLKALLETPDDLSSAEQFQTAKNLTDAAFRATGLAPLDFGR